MFPYANVRGPATDGELPATMNAHDIYRMNSASTALTVTDHTRAQAKRMYKLDNAQVWTMTKYSWALNSRFAEFLRSRIHDIVLENLTGPVLFHIVTSTDKKTIQCTCDQAPDIGIEITFLSPVARANKPDNQATTTDLVGLCRIRAYKLTSTGRREQMLDEQNIEMVYDIFDSIVWPGPHTLLNVVGRMFDYWFFNI